MAGVATDCATLAVAPVIARIIANLATAYASRAAQWRPAAPWRAARASRVTNPALRCPDSEYIIEVFDDHGALVARYDGFEGVLV